ncbi:hypothetical protein PISMIDRAFT_607095 [Pisolithus microcarpus 441]|uniref:Uncharacterized protein n=1 Tax=Pisolithus microcarpus 441 TaxID=765257 RepID=A0A0C9ZFV4_9AGAM|nr:hypothetical protein PISMIDRAFT_607095 [Pisolithus microcarpus 441]
MYTPIPISVVCNLKYVNDITRHPDNCKTIWSWNGKVGKRKHATTHTACKLHTNY